MNKPASLDLAHTITAQTLFGAPDFNGNRLFCVREGICAEDALTQARQLLSSAQASAWDTAQHLTLNDQALLLGIAQQAEMAKALVDSVLEGFIRSGNCRRE